MSSQDITLRGVRSFSVQIDASPQIYPLFTKRTSVHRQTPSPSPSFEPLGKWEKAADLNPFSGYQGEMSPPKEPPDVLQLFSRKTFFQLIVPSSISFS